MESGHEDAKGRDHADGDDRHLVFLCDAHRIGPAADRVGDDEQAARGDRDAQRESEHRREHDGRRVDRDAGAQAALQEEERGAEQPRLA